MILLYPKKLTNNNKSRFTDCVDKDSRLKMKERKTYVLPPRFFPPCLRRPPICRFWRLQGRHFRTNANKGHRRHHQIGLAQESDWVGLDPDLETESRQKWKFFWYLKRSYDKNVSKRPAILWLNKYFVLRILTQSCAKGSGDILRQKRSLNKQLDSFFSSLCAISKANKFAIKR